MNITRDLGTYPISVNPLMEGAQWKAPSHGDVCQGGGKEAEDKAGLIVAEDHYGCLLGLRETFGGGVIIYIPWEGADSFR